MTSGDFGRRTSHGILWSTLTAAGSRAVTFVTTMVLARLLVPSQFGLVAAVLVFLSLLELASDLGMNATVVYEQQHGITPRLHVAFTVNLIFAALLAGVGVALAPLFARLFDVPGHADLFRLAMLSLLFTGLGNIHDSLLLRELEFRRRAIPQIVRAILRGVVSITLALAGFGATALVIGMLVGSAAWSATQWILTRYQPRLSLDREILRSMASYGGAAAVLEVVSVVATRVDQVVVARILGQYALGLYAIALRVPEVAIDSVSWTVSIVAFPSLARQRVADHERLGEATLSLLRYQALYAVPVAAALAVLASPLIVVLFSYRWHAAGGVLSAIAVVSGITAVIFPLGDVFKALGRQRTLVAMSVVQIPLYTLVMIAVAHNGIVAVAWSRAAATALHASLMMLFVMRAAKIRLADVLRAARPAVAAGVGVAGGAGVVRLLWPALSIGPLVLGVLAAAGAGCLALRLLAPGTIGEVLSLVRSRERSRAMPVGVATSPVVSGVDGS